MAELAEQPALGIGEERRARVADHDERVSAAHHAGVVPSLTRHSLEVAVVAVFGLESLEEARRERQRIAGRRAEREPDVIRPGQRLRILQRQIGHDRHAVVLDLAVPQRARSHRVVRNHGLQQILPVCRNGRGAVTTDGSEELFAVVEIGSRQHPAVRCQPFDPSWTMKGRPVFGPTARIGSAKQKHDLLDELQRQIGCMDLQD
jgi:hypothetical protein